MKLGSRVEGFRVEGFSESHIQSCEPLQTASESRHANLGRKLPLEAQDRHECRQEHCPLENNRSYSLLIAVPPEQLPPPKGLGLRCLTILHGSTWVFGVLGFRADGFRVCVFLADVFRDCCL